VGHGMSSGIHLRAAADRFAGAGGDDISVRLVTGGQDPVTVIEATSTDRDWALRHSHPWDELTYVVEGTMEFRVGDQHAVGGPGTLVSLPRGVPHTLRVPEGAARYLMITVGAPSLDFLKEVGRAYAEGPTRDKLLEIAGRHGVEAAVEEE
jgi:mannose-6-phosphate isomerase-like protein (cupin superfamily)